MSKRIITLTDARRVALTGNPFNMVFATFDEKRNTGGERVAVEGCRMMRNEEDKKEITAPRPEQSRDASTALSMTGAPKMPRHLLHNTFNVLLKNQQTQKVHWLLIEEFNGNKVVL